MGYRESSAVPKYLSQADPNDPLVAPINSPAVLAKFPPTLILTATRSSDMSGAIYTHGQLVKLGVEAELHMWDGLPSAFFYNPGIPESKEA